MIYLLVFPRSGSSFARYCLSFLTESRPLQPDGNCELDHLLSKFYKNPPVFKKFHRPHDSGANIVISPENKLCITKRNPIENILSYMFSNEHFDQKGQSDSKMSEFVNYVISNRHDILGKYVNYYVEIMNYFDAWPYEKDMIYYEAMMNSPEIELARISGFWGFSEERVNPIKR